MRKWKLCTKRKKTWRHVSHFAARLLQRLENCRLPFKPWKGKKCLDFLSCLEQKLFLRRCEIPEFPLQDKEPSGTFWNFEITSGWEVLVWGGGVSGDRKKVSLKRRAQVNLFSLSCGSRRRFVCRGKSIELSSGKFTTPLSFAGFCSPEGTWKMGSCFLEMPDVGQNPPHNPPILKNLC